MVSPGGPGRGPGRAGVLQATDWPRHARQWLPSPGHHQPLSGAFWPPRVSPRAGSPAPQVFPGAPPQTQKRHPAACPPKSRKQERVCPGQGDCRATGGLCSECVPPSLLDGVCLALSPGRLTTWHPQRGGELRREGGRVWVDTEPQPPSGARHSGGLPWRLGGRLTRRACVDQGTGRLGSALVGWTAPG